MMRERLPFGVHVPNRHAGRSPVALVMPTSTAGRALGMREVSIRAIDDGRRTPVVHAQGPNAEAAADSAFLQHVRNVREKFEWWVSIQVVLEDGTVRDFEHRVGQYHTNGTVRQAAILHAAWRFMGRNLDDMTRNGHLRAAEQLAGKPVRILQPSLREVQAHEQRHATIASGLRIASKLHADHLVIAVDLNAPLLSRDIAPSARQEADLDPMEQPAAASPGTAPLDLRQAQPVATKLDGVLATHAAGKSRDLVPLEVVRMQFRNEAFEGRGAEGEVAARLKLAQWKQAALLDHNGGDIRIAVTARGLSEFSTLANPYQVHGFDVRDLVSWICQSRAKQATNSPSHQEALLHIAGVLSGRHRPLTKPQWPPALSAKCMMCKQHVPWRAARVAGIPVTALAPHPRRLGGLCERTQREYVDFDPVLAGSLTNDVPARSFDTHEAWWQWVNNAAAAFTPLKQSVETTSPQGADCAKAGLGA